MNVYWLEQTEADAPQEDDWLSESELVRLESFRIAKRRADWLLGRWTAKLAVSSYLNLGTSPDMLARIEVRPELSGAPTVFMGGEPAAVAVSLSHRGGRALCAVAAPNVRLGCDLETIEPRSAAFIEDYFTAEEIALIAASATADQARLVTMLWSAKESALKVLREGLRLDTRSVAVTPDLISENSNRDWNPLWVCLFDGRVFHGWWQERDGAVRTLVGDVPLSCPTELPIPAYSSGNVCRAQ